MKKKTTIKPKPVGFQGNEKKIVNDIVKDRLDKHQVLDIKLIIKELDERLNSKSSETGSKIRPLKIHKTNQSVIKEYLADVKRDLPDTKERLESVSKDVEPLKIIPGYEGKIYKEGDIITVGYNPFYYDPSKVRRRKPKGKRAKINEEIEAGEALFARENIEEEPEFEEEGEEERMEREIEREMDEEEGDEKEEEGYKIGGKRKGKSKVGSWEPILTFKEKEVPIVSGKELKLAKKKKLNYKKTILLIEEAKQRIRDKELRFEDYYEYEVVRDASGKLILKTPSKYEKLARSINVIDTDSFPPPILDVYKPSDIVPPKAPAGYKGKVKFGSCITFVTVIAVDVSGVVLRADSKTFDYVTKYGTEHKNVPLSDVNIIKTKKVAKSMLVTKDAGKNKKSKTIKISVPSVKDPNAKIFDITIGNEKLTKRSTYIKSGVWKKYENVNGIVTGFGTDGFIVMTTGKKNGGDRLIIPFDDPTIKKIKCQDKKNVLANLSVAEVSSKDYMEENVTETTRTNIAKFFFDEISEIIPKVYTSEETDTKSNKNKDDNHETDIDWTLIREPLMSWDNYYGSQFKQWLFANKWPYFNSISPDFVEEAERQYSEMIDSDAITNNLMNLYGADIFSGTGIELLNRIENLEKGDTLERVEPTLLSLCIKRELLKIKNLDGLHGEKLAIELSVIIFNFLLYHPPPDIEELRGSLTEGWIIEEFNSYQPTDEDRQNFESEVLIAVQATYDEYKKEWESSSEKAKIYEKKRDEKEKKRDEKEKKEKKRDEKEKKRDEKEKKRDEKKKEVPKVQEIKTVNGKYLSELGVQVAEYIKILEEKLFLEHGDSNETYLYRCFKLLLCLSKYNNVGHYCEYLRRQIKARPESIRDLNDATDYDIFPEFFLNYSGPFLKEKCDRELNVREEEIYNNERAKIEERHRAELKERSINKENKELEEEYREALLNLIEKHRKEGGTLGKEYQTELKKLQKEYDDKFRQLEESMQEPIEAYQTELRELREEYSDKFNQLNGSSELNTIKEEYNDKIRQIEESMGELLESYRTKLNSSKQEYEDKFKKLSDPLKLTKLRERYDNKFKQLKESIREPLETYQKELKEVREEYGDKFKQIKESPEMKELREEYNDKFRRIEEELAKFSSVHSVYRIKEATELRGRHERELSELEEKYKNKERQESEEYDRCISRQKEQYKRGIKRFEYEIYEHVLDFIDNYILKLAKRKEFTTEFNWKNYVIPITSNQCKDKGFRIKAKTKDGSYAKYGGLADLENYDCASYIDKDSEEYRWKCKAKIEPIPDNELIVDYDSIRDTFTCSSLIDILYALKEENEGKVPKDVTGNAYNKEFLQRMRERYEDILEKNLIEDRTTEFTTTDKKFVGALFGVDEFPDDIIIEEKEKEIEEKEEKIEKKEKRSKKSKRGSKKEKKRKAKVLSPLESAFEDIGDRKLVIVFYDSYIRTKVQKSYQPYVDDDEIKVVDIALKDDNEELEILKELRATYSMKKRIPLWVVFDDKDSNPKIVYENEITSKFTVGQALKKLLS